MRASHLHLLWLPLLLATAGCGTDDRSPSSEVVSSDKQRITDPQVVDTDFTKQVQGDTEFALAVYQQVRGEPKNLFYSPHSISIALAMLYAGATNQTEQQMATALHYLLPQDKLHPFFDKLDLALNSRGEGEKAADGKAFRLRVVNATWGQRGFSFLASYLDTLAQNYGSGLRLLDFAADAEGSRQLINDWVLEQTEERIKDLLPAGSISSATRLVLANAIYFNAAWLKAFEEKNTRQAAFHVSESKTVQVQMMSGTLQQGAYVKGAGYQAARLPYAGGELSMVVIAPDELESFEARLTAAGLQELLGKLADAEVTLSLPRFTVEHQLPLKDVLMALGMTDAFGAAADLSGINGDRSLYVSGAFHKAFVKVNEAGTEAAAATAVVVDEKAAVEQASLTVDRPFLFLVEDHATGAVIFLGRVLDPTL